MEKSFFLMSCSRLAHDIHCTEDINQKGFLTPYWEAYGKMDAVRFAEVITYLGNTWHKRLFPLKADFNVALYTTKRLPEYAPKRREVVTSIEDPEEYSRDMLALAGKYKPIGGVDNKPIKPRQLLYKEMFEAGKIYSVKLGEWIDRSSAGTIGGDFFYPEKHYKAPMEKAF